MRPVVGLDLAQVTVGLVQPPRRCMTIDHLATVRTRTVGPSARTTKDHIRINSQGREGWRQNGEGQTMLVAQERDPVKGCCPDIETGELRERAGGMVAGGGDARVRKQI